MPVPGVSTATLRVKTGCLTCRSRRKKCNEKRPRCGNCSKSNRICSWPTEDELLDRRHRRVSKSPKSLSQSHESSPTGSSPAVEVSPPGVVPSFFICHEIAANTDLFNSKLFKSDLEIDCLRHFLDAFLPPLILTNTHPGFHAEIVPEFVEMSLRFDGLKDVLLACGASHINLFTGSAEMNEAGIQFYSRAVSAVNRALSQINWADEDFNDALILCIIFLYVHGIYTIRTNKDIAKHVKGAIQLVKLRSIHSKRPPIQRPIHRIIWESILYQVFRQTVNRPFAIDFQPDVEFCLKAEENLKSLTFPDASPADNSPVIGFPLRLQKFIIEIVQLCKSPAKPDPQVLQSLTGEMEFWEGKILNEGHCVEEEGPPIGSAKQGHVFREHSTSLHILAASLLLDWVSRSQEISCEGEVKLPPTSQSWQVRRALKILRCPQISEEWSGCYLGSWPSLILGYAVDKPEDVALIRNDFEQRFHKLYSGEELLFIRELEEVWRMRGISDTPV